MKCRLLSLRCTIAGMYEDKGKRVVDMFSVHVHCMCATLCLNSDACTTYVHTLHYQLPLGCSGRPLWTQAGHRCEHIADGTLLAGPRLQCQLRDGGSVQDPPGTKQWWAYHDVYTSYIPQLSGCLQMHGPLLMFYLVIKLIPPFFDIASENVSCNYAMSNGPGERCVLNEILHYCASITEKLNF